MKEISFLSFFLLIAGAHLLRAQGSFKATVSQSTLEVGQIFTVTYQLEKEEASAISVPDFIPFTIFAGPSRSTSVSIINGVKTSSSSWSYQLMAPDEPGNYKIEPATITLKKGKKIQSNALNIEVLSGATTRNPSASKTNPGNLPFFVKVQVPEGPFFPGQMIELECVIYSKVGLAAIELVHVPDWANSASFRLKQYGHQQHESVINGQKYYSKSIYKVAIFPQKAGPIQIAPFAVRVAVDEGGGNDFWFPFSRNYQYTQLQSEAIALEVLPLPTGAPPKFDGAVGQWNVEAYLATPILREGQAASVKVRIKGQGDLKRIQAPEIEWPEALDQFDVVLISEQYNELTSGLIGEKTFEYILVPNQTGSFAINSPFVFFDPIERLYKERVVKLPELKVQEGKQTFAAESDAVSRTDSLSSSADEPPVNVVGGRAWWWGTSLTAIFAFVMLIYYRSRKRSQASDKLKSFQTQATEAVELAERSRGSATFLEINRQIYKWVALETATDSGGLTKDFVHEYLKKRVEDSEDKTLFLELLHQCETALYAPMFSAADIHEAVSTFKRLAAKYFGKSHTV